LHFVKVIDKNPLKAMILHMREIIDSLADFGLSEKEALTYVTLLQIGKSNVKKSRLKFRRD
jgi:hypothetical protein